MAGLAAVTLILGLYLGVVIMTFPIILVFVVLGFVGVGGRRIVEWGPIGARCVGGPTPVPPPRRQTAPGGNTVAARRRRSSQAMG
jgi:hypothetical protein